MIHLLYVRIHFFAIFLFFFDMYFSFAAENVRIKAVILMKTQEVSFS